MVRFARFLTVVFASVVLSPLAGFAQVPEDLMERRAMAFVHAHNSGDPLQILAYRKEHRVPDDMSDKDARSTYTRVFDRLGKLKVQGVRIDEASVLTLLASAEKGQNVELRFTFGREAPYLVESIQLALTGGGGPPASSLPAIDINPRMSGKDMAKRLDKYLGGLTKDDVYSGVTFIAHGGDVLYQNAHGLASKTYKVPNTTETAFRVGSITKDFTKVAVGQLMQQGKLHMDDTIAQHLPDYPNSEVASRITVGQLVTHTSGMGSMNFGQFSELSKLRFREPDDYFTLFADQPLLFDPGTSKQYSNAGYIVLGAIIASASGMRYSDYIEHKVFEPAGMLHSKFLSLDRPNPGIATGYMKCLDDPDEWCTNVHIMEIDGGPSGGSYSTALDMWNFDRALRENRLLSREYTNWFFTNELPGTVAAELPERWPMSAFAGGAEGVSTIYISDGNWFICVLCNYDEPIAEEVGMQLYRALLKSGDSASDTRS